MILIQFSIEENMKIINFHILTKDIYEKVDSLEKTLMLGGIGGRRRRR